MTVHCLFDRMHHLITIALSQHAVCNVTVPHACSSSARIGIANCRRVVAHGVEAGHRSRMTFVNRLPSRSAPFSFEFSLSPVEIVTNDYSWYTLACIDFDSCAKGSSSSEVRQGLLQYALISYPASIGDHGQRPNAVHARLRYVHSIHYTFRVR